MTMRTPSRHGTPDYAVRILNPRGCNALLSLLYWYAFSTGPSLCPMGRHMHTATLYLLTSRRIHENLTSYISTSVFSSFKSYSTIVSQSQKRKAASHSHLQLFSVN